MIRFFSAVLAVLVAAAPIQAGGLTFGARQELTVLDKPHEAHVSAPAVAVTREGGVVVAWIAQQGHDNNLLVAQPGSAPKPVRVNPEGLFVESLHQPPGLALGPGDEVYVSWSSPKPIPDGGLFASDLRLSRSLDGGKTFESPRRVNEDRPISHSFEGLRVMPDGTVIVAWIDSRAGASTANTYLARIIERGSRVEAAQKLDTAKPACAAVSTSRPDRGKPSRWRGGKSFPAASATWWSECPATGRARSPRPASFTPTAGRSMPARIVEAVWRWMAAVASTSRGTPKRPTGSLECYSPPAVML